MHWLSSVWKDEERESKTVLSFNAMFLFCCVLLIYFRPAIPFFLLISPFCEETFSLCLPNHNLETNNFFWVHKFNFIMNSPDGEIVRWDSPWTLNFWDSIGNIEFGEKQSKYNVYGRIWAKKKQYAQYYAFVP